MTEIPDIKFPAPLQCLFEPKRYKVLYGGRGAGRSWSVARALLLLGLSGKERILCARELQASIRDSVHKLLADQISLMGLEAFYDIQQQGIYGKGSAQGTEFSFEGIRHNITKIKSYEGITRCWIEEADKLSRASLDILIPTVRAEGSEIWFTFNPDLEDDEVYQRFVLTPGNLLSKKNAQYDKGWGLSEYPHAYVIKMTWRDNPWFPDVLKSELEDLKSRNIDAYLHVWEGNTKAALEGAIFADELRDARANGRICRVPVDRSVPVNVYFDLGRSDHTSMWFEQRVSFEHHIVDFYQNRLKHIDHYLLEMQKKGYLYGNVWLPHDAKALTLGTKMSIEEQVRAAGYRVRIVPKLKINDRINAARTVFQNCFFDEKNCEEGLRSLKHYQYEIRADSKKRSENPLHDWASDAADAFCYFAVASKQRVREPDCKLEMPKSTLVGKLGELFLPTPGESAQHNWLGR